MAVKDHTKQQANTGIRNRIREPKKYKVIMYNDNFTTMEFVVDILVQIFHKSEPEAEQLMMTVHRKGQAVVGVYPMDIAKTRVNKALQQARKQGYPFRMSIEEE